MMNAVVWPWLSCVESHPALAGYRPVLGDKGMVSSPHASASTIGAAILGCGGNAVDAALATSAALMVLLPMQCGLGGDAFWLIGDSGGIKALDASGRMPQRANIEELQALGHEEIPPRSAYSVTVPGAVSGWIKVHEAYGSMSLDELLQPAIELAEMGYILSRHGVASFLVAEEELRRKDALCLWSQDGSLPRLYQRIKQPSLAATLRRIANSYGADFYGGTIAKNMSETALAAGGWLTEQDLAAHEAEWVDTICAPFRDCVIHTTPASSQGFALLAALRRSELTSKKPLSNSSPDDIHLLVEAVGASLQDRDTYTDDRSRLRPEFGNLWSVDRAREFVGTFDPAKRSVYSALPGTRTTKGDTAHLAVVDRDGMVVSLIQSLFFDFGSGIPVKPHGFTLQNRGAAFHLDKSAPGALAPGLRPPSTLMPSIMTRNGNPVLVFGCMGGDGQVQTQLQLLVNLVDSGFDPQQAISVPRWYLDRSGQDECLLLVEEGFDQHVLNGLTAKGHRLRRLTRWEEIMGHAQAIAIEAAGILVGGADPRSDGQVGAP